MTIKAVIFDMDGVLIEAKEWHYDSLNKALALFGFEISRYAHLTTYDGLPTKRKLEMLSIEQGVPKGLHTLLNDLKQRYTMEMVHTLCKPNFAHEQALATLVHKGYKLACCSNSVKASVEGMLSRAGLLKYLEFFFSNQDVSKAKPDPEMYLKAIQKFGFLPSECLIVEDNENGIKAAYASGAHVLEVASTEDVNLSNILNAIAKAEGGLSCKS